MLFIHIHSCEHEFQSRTQSVVEETQSVTNNRSSLSNDNHDTYINYEENDYIDETFPQQTESTSTNQNADDQSVGYCSGKNYPMRATVLYNFQVSQFVYTGKQALH